MQLTPRYGDRPLIVLEGEPAAIATPLVRQRRRLEAALGELDADGWARPTRCAGWSVRDVVAHLDTVNGFWTYSIGAGLGGVPSRVLQGFDPAATPAQLVDATRTQAWTETFASFRRSNAELIALVDSLDDAAWTATAEAPPGHQSVSAVLHHALWDAWVHERDVLLPAGGAPAIEPDEVVAGLRYAVALAPALALTLGPPRQGRIDVVVSDPELTLNVTVTDQVRVAERAGGSPPLGGDAIDVLEGLSVRRPLDHHLPPDVSWMVSGLATAFDVAG